MTLQSTMTLLLIAAINASLTVCASISVKQAWGSNFARADGTTANDPTIIDGNIGTLGQSQYVEATGDAIMGMEAQSEAVIPLPEPKSNHRVVIHARYLGGRHAERACYRQRIHHGTEGIDANVATSWQK